MGTRKELVNESIGGSVGSARTLCDVADLRPPKITQVEMTEADIEKAQKVARQLGYSQMAYTSSSALWGLYCLSDGPKHKSGCIIKTAEFGFLFVQDLEDLHIEKVGLWDH